MQRQLGRYTEAEAAFRRALTIRETRLGPDNADVAATLSSLALLYMSLGRWDESEALFKRAIAIQEKALPESADLAFSLNGLGILYRRTPRYAEAIPLHQRAIAIREKLYGPDHPAVAASLNDLGDAYRWLRRPQDAEPPIRRGLQIRETRLGPEHPWVAFSLHSLASVLAQSNRPREAEDAYRRAITVATDALGADHFDAIYPRLSLADFYRRRGAFDAALTESRLVVDSVARNLESEAARRIAGGEFEARRYRGFFLQKIVLDHQVGHDAPDRRPLLAAEAFETVQLALASSAGRAVAGMAARFAAADDGLARAVRERQDLAERWRRLDDLLVSAAGHDGAERDPAVEAKARAELASVTQSLHALDARITRDFPSYDAMMSPRPVKLAAVQALLDPDEALLVYLSGSSPLANVDATWLWVVRRDRIGLHRMEVTETALRGHVAALRAGLEPTQDGSLQPFDVARAHTLYNVMLAPAAPMLAGVHHLLIVPDGALQSVPFSLLVTAKPADPTDYRAVPWLARQFAMTTLPSVASLRALRTLAAGAHAGAPFLGIGDPTLQGQPGTARGVKVAALFRGGGADVAALRQLPPLPDTADELRALARAQGVGDDTVYLRERATESVVRGLKLDQYRVLAFATHGLVAGDLAGLAEPALVLTPPAQASSANDGLLTASEIAQLKLNADWVILSACNTAAGDGTPGAEGLSGLARAFFYAGSRALLVSHWPVASQAAVRLTTGTLAALQREPKLGRAEALRRSQLALLDDASLDRAYTHPLAWAPFVVVGEGGAGR